MENIEFIPANELPASEAEEVSVLCLENGELKQKPGASLSGAGGYVIALTEDSCEVDESGFAYIGNYDEFADILYNGGSVWLDMTALVGTTNRLFVTSWGYEEGVIILLSSMEGQQLTIACPNGTWTPPAV